MRLYPKPKTDTEYIEFVRKYVKRSKWFVLFHICASVGFLVLYWLLLRAIYSADSTIPGFCKAIDTGIYIGMMLGAFAGVLLVFAAINVVLSVQCLHGYRTEQLMLKFHDELKKEDK